MNNYDDFTTDNLGEAMRCKTPGGDTRRCINKFPCNKRTGVCTNKITGRMARARGHAVGARSTARRRPRQRAAVLPGVAQPLNGIRPCERGMRCQRGTRCVRNRCLNQEARDADILARRAVHRPAVAQYYADQANKAERLGLAQVNAAKRQQEQDLEDHFIEQRQQQQQERVRQEQQDRLRQEQQHQQEEENQQQISMERRAKESNDRRSQERRAKESNDRRATDAPIRMRQLANELIQNLNKKLILNNFISLIKNNEILVFRINKDYFKSLNETQLNEFIIGNKPIKPLIVRPNIMSVTFPVDANEKTLLIKSTTNSDVKDEEFEIIIETIKAIGDYYSYRQIIFDDQPIDRLKNIEFLQEIKSEFELANKHVVAWRSFPDSIKIAMYDTTKKLETIIQDKMYYQLLTNLEHGWDETIDSDGKMVDSTGGSRKETVFNNQCFEIAVARTDTETIGGLEKEISILMIKCCPQDHCTLRASDIINRLISVSNRLNSNLYIDSDESYDFLGKKTKKTKNYILLYYYFIFLYGHSLYQRMGFNNENNEREFDNYNDQIRNIPIINILNDPNKYYFHDYLFRKNLETLEQTLDTMDLKNLEEEINKREIKKKKVKNKGGIDQSKEVTYLRELLSDYIVNNKKEKPSVPNQEKIKTAMKKLNKLTNSNIDLNSTINQIGEEILKIIRSKPPINIIYEDYIFTIYEQLTTVNSTNNKSLLFLFKYDPKDLLYNIRNVPARK